MKLLLCSPPRDSDKSADDVRLCDDPARMPAESHTITRSLPDASKDCWLDQPDIIRNRDESFARLGQQSFDEHSLYT